MARLKRVTLGASGQSSGVGGGIKCPICDVRDVSSEHIAMHFTGELNQYIEAKMPPGGQTCNLCTNFKAHPAGKMNASNTLNMHLALTHGKLEELLQSAELVRAKRLAVFQQRQLQHQQAKLQQQQQHQQAAAVASAVKPSVPQTKCPICDVPMATPSYKEHVLWHFTDELKQVQPLTKLVLVC